MKILIFSIIATLAIGIGLERYYVKHHRDVDHSFFKAKREHAPAKKSFFSSTPTLVEAK